MLPDLDFFKHHFLRVFEKIEPDKGGIFKTPFLRVFEKWDPDIFQKSQISKISSSGHSENAQIKLVGFQWVFGGWGDAPFIFFYGPDGPKVQKWTPELFIHLRGAIGIYRGREADPAAVDRDGGAPKWTNCSGIVCT